MSATVGTKRKASAEDAKQAKQRRVNATQEDIAAMQEALQSKMINIPMILNPSVKNVITVTDLEWARTMITMVDRCVSNKWLMEPRDAKHFITLEELKKIEAMCTLVDDWDAYKASGFKPTKPAIEAADMATWIEQLNPNNMSLVTIVIGGDQPGKKIKPVPRDILEKMDEAAVENITDKNPRLVVESPIVQVRGVTHDANSPEKQHYKPDDKHFYTWTKNFRVGIANTVRPPAPEYLYGTKETKAQRKARKKYEKENVGATSRFFAPTTWAYLQPMEQTIFGMGVQFYYLRCMEHFRVTNKVQGDLSTYMAANDKFTPFSTTGTNMEPILTVKAKAYRDQTLAEMVAYVGDIAEDEERRVMTEQKPKTRMEKLIAIAKARDPAGSSLEFSAMQTESHRETAMRNHGQVYVPFTTNERDENAWAESDIVLEAGQFVATKFTFIAYAYRSGQNGMKLMSGAPVCIAGVAPPSAKTTWILDLAQSDTNTGRVVKKNDDEDSSDDENLSTFPPVPGASEDQEGDTTHGYGSS